MLLLVLTMVINNINNILQPQETQDRKEVEFEIEIVILIHHPRQQADRRQNHLIRQAWEYSHRDDIDNDVVRRSQNDDKMGINKLCMT